jgi:hypothetical protein
MTSGTTTWLSGVWGSSGSDVFAVGGSGTILHYGGSTWSPMTSGTTNPLSGVWGSSSTDVFAVGATQVGGTILHYSGEATAINLSSFTATLSKRSIILEWVTESEIDNAGFNVYRADSANGEYVKINSSLIPAKGTSTSGASYQYVDENIRMRRTYYYKLEDIDIHGASSLHVPVSATARIFQNLR